MKEQESNLEKTKNKLKLSNHKLILLFSIATLLSSLINISFLIILNLKYGYSPFKSGFNLLGYISGVFFIASFVAQTIASITPNIIEISQINKNNLGYVWSITGLVLIIFAVGLFPISLKESLIDWESLLTFLVLGISYFLSNLKKLIAKDNIIISNALFLMFIISMILFFSYFF